MFVLAWLRLTSCPGDPYRSLQGAERKQTCSLNCAIAVVHHQSLVQARAVQEEVRKFARFLAVGGLNTAVAYVLILIGLALGLDDYQANATAFVIGLPISWTTHRLFTFAVKTRPSVAEAVRYGIVVAIAYCANLAVLCAGNAMGWYREPLLQAAAIGTYAIILFVLTRLAVFAPRPSGFSRN